MIAGEYWDIGGKYVRFVVTQFVGEAGMSHWIFKSCGFSVQMDDLLGF